MLVIGSNLINFPILSLHVGGEVARLALLGVERHQRVCQEVRVRQVIEVRRHIFLHTLQVLHTRIRLNLRRGQTSPTGDRQQ